MTYTESALGSAITLTGGGFTITIDTRIATGISAGWNLIADVTAQYDIDDDTNDEPISLGCPTAVQNCTGTAPSNWSWTLENTRSVTQGDYTQEFRQYSARPLDGSSLPIGSAYAYMRVSLGFYDSNPNPGVNISLAWDS